MLKKYNVVKKMSAIFMSVLLCSTSVVTGYADKSIENSSVNEITGDAAQTDV